MSLDVHKTLANVDQVPFCIAFAPFSVFEETVYFVSQKVEMLRCTLCRASLFHLLSQSSGTKLNYLKDCKNTASFLGNKLCIPKDIYRFDMALDERI